MTTGGGVEAAVAGRSNCGRSEGRNTSSTNLLQEWIGSRCRPMDHETEGEVETEAVG